MRSYAFAWMIVFLHTLCFASFSSSFQLRLRLERLDRRLLYLLFLFAGLFLFLLTKGTSTDIDFGLGLRLDSLNHRLLDLLFLFNGLFLFFLAAK